MVADSAFGAVRVVPTLDFSATDPP